MQARSASGIYQFEGFRLNRRGLFRHDEDAAAVDVGSRALDVLRVLLERPGDLLSRHEILASAWPGIVVEDNNLNIQISGLRRVLDRDRANGSCIETVPGRGYRFILPVTRAEPSGRPISPPPRLSIVVLPFANIGNHPDQQYFAHGITEDVTTDLSRIVGMFVISRNTAFTYGNRAVDTRQICRELGVRYVLQGSVQRSGKQVRVSAQLIDAESDAHLWAERFDRDTSDLFAVQNEITSRIAVALNIELVAVEAARPSVHPDALDYILRARAAALNPPSYDRNVAVVRLCEGALVLDPRSAEAQSRLAGHLAGRVLDNMTDTATADLARGEALAERALAAAPRSALAHYAKGQVLRAQRRYAEAILEYETVLASDPNWAFSFYALGQCKLYTGSMGETIPLVERAIRLSPRDPLIGVWSQQIGLVHLVQSRTAEAITWLEKARNHTPAHPKIRAQLASAYALSGDISRAAAELAEARRLSRDDSFSSVARLLAVRYSGVPKIRALFEATYIAGLRKAGMPEE